MVLSNSQPFLPAAEFYTAPKSKAILKPRSYAQVVSAKQRVSLMHKDINEPDQDSDSPLKELQSRVYRASRSPNAFMLDITQVKSEYTDLQCMQELKAQHSNVYACTILRDESTQYLELYLEKEKDNNDILETGVVFNKLKLRIMPCRAVDDTVKMIKVKLTYLLMLPRESVLEDLKKSLAPFGHLVDVGINTETTTGFFMGAGYAVLAVPKEVTDLASSQFQKLDHNVHWCEENNEIFHATWDNMPTWCRYCHQTGHTKFDCEKSKARIGDSDSPRTKSEQRLEKTSHKSRSEGDSSDTEDSDYKPSDDDDDKMEESSSEEENSEGQEIDAMEVEDLEKDTAKHRTKESITNIKLP
ncbi:hypothetical protein G6F17_011097 [Rhizopus arrhizus]|uniref:CCHC-type domain-containing protein n=1 Tax=Rhizopus oryzae TaxID=64495 RepID=A0A9P6WZP0_RHIOR|nr:hypothetical protein G6F22_009199 [Rhizopus arrhizus]KAG0849067.1 hypothetical protein G6F17_011097 [Rhizopus arrhizus]KAG0986316.1 hypothetical protein G6F28_010288 [Rhizopus arrhizus]KAG1302164.1 hypothetical protein G6F64_011168 [Rhizopus arrhizus]